MSKAFTLKHWNLRTAGLALGQMHGELVSAAILVLVLALLQFGNPTARNALGFFHSMMGIAPSAPTAEASREAPLTAEMRASLEFVSHRYRVSAEALGPVFSAAQTAARQLNLDPLLIVAVIAIESRFNPYAESVAGAQGLMQVIPRWHRNKIPQSGDGLTLFDPEINVQVGAQVLRESIRRMGGLIPGLQQFAGAIDDPDQTYASKVLAEKQRLEAAALQGRKN